MFPKTDGVIPLGQHLGGLVDVRQGPGDAPGDKQRQQHAHGRHHHGEGGHLHLQRLLEGIHRGDGAFQQHHAVEPRGRAGDGDIEDDLILGAVLVYKGGAGHHQLVSPFQVHLVEQVGHIQPGAGEVLQIALLLAGFPAGEHLAVLVGDHNVDACVQAHLAHLLVHVAGLQGVLHRLGGGLHLGGLYGPVEGVQQHNLEQPQQRRHHQDENAEPAEDLPPDAQGAPGPQKTLTCLQNDTPPLSR